jgi:hypothetical protein
MSSDLRINLAIECSKANSDVVRVLRHPRKYGHKRSLIELRASKRLSGLVTGSAALAFPF